MTKLAKNINLSNKQQTPVRALFVLFYLALILPCIYLVMQTYDQLKWESFHQTRENAMSLSQNIAQPVQDWIANERARPVTDYFYMGANIQTNRFSNALQNRSSQTQQQNQSTSASITQLPLPSPEDLITGYFQIDASGKFTTPWLPESLAGLTNEINQLERKQQLHLELFQLVNQVNTTTAPHQSISELKSTQDALINDSSSPLANRSRTAISKEATNTSEPIQPERSAFEGLLSEGVSDDAAQNPPSEPMPATSAQLEKTNTLQDNQEKRTLAEKEQTSEEYGKDGLSIIDNLSSSEKVAEKKAVTNNLYESFQQSSQQPLQETAQTLGRVEQLQQAQAYLERSKKEQSQKDRKRQSRAERVKAAKLKKAEYEQQTAQPQPKSKTATKNPDFYNSQTPKESKQATSKNEQNLIETEMAEESISMNDGMFEFDDTAVPPPLPAEFAMAQNRLQSFAQQTPALSVKILSQQHAVFYRQVTYQNTPLIQGFVVNLEQLFSQFFEQSYYQDNLSEYGNLLIAFNDQVVKAFLQSSALDKYSARNLTSRTIEQATLLNQYQLTGSLKDFSLVYTVKQLPQTSAGNTIIYIGSFLILLLTISCWLMYAFTLKKLKLSQQQQNFVAAVSHELKTPLTSIRMYGEMLQQGWADKEKQQSYYQYIVDESERLTRLINNVLQLAKLSNNNLELNIQPITASSIVDLIQSRLAQILQATETHLRLSIDDSCKNHKIAVDSDALLQVLINLIDNSIKFRTENDSKDIDIKLFIRDTSPSTKDNSLTIIVRDYGPGIAPDQINKVSQLFYRSENELTRKTVGTGIGLALVEQLVSAMKGQIQISNAEPGLQVQLTFALIDD